MAIVASVAAREQGRRIRILAVETAVVLGLTVILTGPYWQTTNPTLGLLTFAGYLDWLGPAQFLFATGGRMAVHLWGYSGRLLAEAGIRGGLALVAATGLVWIAMALVRRVAPARSEASHMEPTRDASASCGPWSLAAQGAAWAWALLVVILASPVIQPWYLAWLLPVAWLLPTRVRNLAIGLSVLLAVAYSIAEPESVPSLSHWISLVGRYVIGPILLVVLGWFVVQTRRIAGGSSALESRDLTQVGDS
jgi:hypothetical protein